MILIKRTKATTMAPLSDFERQRQENIERNKELLKKLNLDTLSNSISRDVQDSKPKKRKTKPAPKPVKKESFEPSRRSRRIAGIKTETDNPEEFNRLKEEEEAKEAKKRELERLKRTRLYGDFNLIDLVTDRKLGQLKFEDKVIKREDEVKQEGVEIDDLAADKEVLEILRNLGDKFSAGDLYEVIRKTPIKYNEKVLEAKREEFDKLKIFPKFDPLDIKITHTRITSMNFHPSVTDRVVMAGDTTGNLGIWAVDSSEEEPTISILHPHGKAISKILTPLYSQSKIYTSSYDGSVRELDLNKLESSQLVYLNDPYESGDYELGVSDINLCQEGDPRILYMTTLSGNFYQYDTRTKFESVSKEGLLRLHDKKIGSFSVNPNLSYQIATASLDRTMKVWDLRNVSQANAKWSDYENQLSPHMYGGYTSRLSISSVDWNSENRLVCNGYDDNVNIINLNELDPPVMEWTKNHKPNMTKKRKGDDEETINNIQPFTKIRHNCQTGRWVSILKSKWQVNPEDSVQKFVIANMKRGLDVYDQEGQILAHLSDSVGAVPAVATFHPTKNWVVGGSASGKVYMFE